jgi:hypothetical protein
MLRDPVHAHMYTHTHMHARTQAHTHWSADVISRCTGASRDLCPGHLIIPSRGGGKYKCFAGLEPGSLKSRQGGPGARPPHPHPQRPQIPSSLERGWGAAKGPVLRSDENRGPLGSRAGCEPRLRRPRASAESPCRAHGANPSPEELWLVCLQHCSPRELGGQARLGHPLLSPVLLE